VSAPAEVASAIQIEAYKKYVLTSLLQYGKVAKDLYFNINWRERERDPSFINTV
jgi:hypothetical protein